MVVVEGWGGQIRMMNFVWWVQFLLKSFVMVEMVGNMRSIDNQMPLNETPRKILTICDIIPINLFAPNK